VDEDDEPNRAGWSPIGEGRRLFDDAYRRADAFVDRGQRRAFRLLWFFLPETSVGHQVRFQAVFASRFFSDAGQQALAYGALIAVVRNGGSAMDAALLGVSALIPPALFGLWGGAVADALPKRIALAGVYNLQALLCFTAPSLIGTDLIAMMALLFAVNTLGQVSGPSESSVIPFVATQPQLASASSMLHLASTLGTAFGTALLAPLLVRAFGVSTVIYVAGGMLLLAASRVFDLPTSEPEPSGNLGPRFLVREVSVRQTLNWLADRPAVATMVFVAVIAGTAQIVIQTLAPRYVQSVLQVDAANAVYVFAPSAVGLGLALIAMPRLIKVVGERTTALLGFVILATALTCFGVVPHLVFLDAINPLRLLAIAELGVNLRLRTAALLALPLGFGLSLTATSVQTYINRRVPLSHQGRTFAMQSSLKNGVAIIPLVSLGAASSAFGVENVLLASPFVLLAMAVGLIQLSRHFGGHAPRGRLEELASYWEEPVLLGPDDGPAAGPEPSVP
jgi:Major Facilitator Superfamily